MLCKSCGTETQIFRQINSSGSRVVVERCPECGRNPNKGKPFLKKADFDWESLPLFQDASLTAEPCSYKGCENKGTEWHHYAPQHLFDDADNWGAGYLCQYHHRLWHEKTETGAYITRRQK